jgi:hypothetical protein
MAQAKHLVSLFLLDLCIFPFAYRHWFSVSPKGKAHVNVVFIGHVDAGKSTMGGNLLYLCDMVVRIVLFQIYTLMMHYVDFPPLGQTNNGKIREGSQGGRARELVLELGIRFYAPGASKGTSWVDIFDAKFFVDVGVTGKNGRSWPSIF